MIRLLCWLLSRKSLKREDRVRLLNEALSTAGALPLHASITADGGVFLIKGVPVEGEYAVKIRENASAALHNLANKAVDEQVLYQAISLGIHEAQNFDQTLFSKAAIWVVQERQKLLERLAQGTPELGP